MEVDKLEADKRPKNFLVEFGAVDRAGVLNSAFYVESYGKPGESP
jgi:hypothetical protein